MPDIKLKWTGHNADMSIVDDDLDGDYGMTTAVILSLFVDQIAGDGDDIPSGDGDRRGWYGDYINSSIHGDRTGSKLWLLGRAPILENIEDDAKGFIDDSLQWMIDDLVASEIISSVKRVGDGIKIEIEIVRPSGDRVNFKFDHVWEPPPDEYVPPETNTGTGSGPSSPVFPINPVDWSASIQSVQFPDAIYDFQESSSPIVDHAGSHDLATVPANLDLLFAESGPSGSRLNIGLKSNNTESLGTAYLRAAADNIPGASNDGHFMTADGSQIVSGVARVSIDTVGRIVAHISNGFVATPQQGWSIDAMADRIQLRWKALGGNIYTADVLGNFLTGVEMMIGWNIDTSTSSGTMQLMTSSGNSPVIQVGNDRNDDELFRMRIGSIFGNRARCSFRYMSLWSSNYALTSSGFSEIIGVVGI